MKGTKQLWVGGLAMLLASGLFAASVNAGPPSSNPGNPFQEILNKLEHIQTGIERITVPEGNPTLR